MTIETKYSIRQDVWAIRDGKPWEGRVTHINTATKDVGLYSQKLRTMVTYHVNAGTFRGSGDFREDQLFNSKEELLQSL